MAWLLEATEIGGMSRPETALYAYQAGFTAARERANYGAVWALSSMGALDQVMPSIWEDIKWFDERID